MARLEEEERASCDRYPVPEVPSSSVVVEQRRRGSRGSMRDDTAATAVSLTTTTTRRESVQSGVFPFLISDPRAWEEVEEQGAVGAVEGAEAHYHGHDHPHEMTVSSHSRSGSGSGGENWTFGRPMMFMRRSSLPVAAASASASHLGSEDNSDLDVVPSDQGRRFVLGPSGIPLGDDDVTRIRTGGVGMEDTSDEAVVEVKHDEGGGDGDTGHGIDIPWDRSRLHERYGMAGERGGSGSGGYGLMVVRPDISTAATSFVTAPLTMEEATTTESGVGSHSSSNSGGGGGGIGLGGIGPERRDRMGDWRQR